MSSSPVTRRVEVRYFAALRAARGLPLESIETTATTANTLYDELAARHGFRLGREAVRFALNGEFAAGAAPIADGDRIDLLPPFAGG